MVRARDPAGGLAEDGEFWVGLFDAFREAKQTRSKTLTLGELALFFGRVAKVGHDSFYRGARTYLERYPERGWAYCAGIIRGEGEGNGKAQKGEDEKVSPEEYQRIIAEVEEGMAWMRK